MNEGQGNTRTAAHPTPMTEAEFRELYRSLRAGLPWDAADRRGALNYLTHQDTLAAAGQVRLGRSVSLAAPIEDTTSADNPHPAVHEMTGTGADADDDGLSFGTDRIAMNVHGNADSHIDALCHVMFDGRLYNGVPAEAGRRVWRRRAVHRRWPRTASPGEACCSTSRPCAERTGSSQATT